ncbi:hypothetical protein [Novosphingobium sp. BL-52-GroH]|uniref:hypothetical protein n=1 Tax=Novosphingobium sp. BL-52-GroH TaxID=3349877 RepID=UPI00384DCB45
MATSLIVRIKRRADLTPGEFLRHWRGVDAPLLLACSPFSRHILCYEEFHMPDRNLRWRCGHRISRCARHRRMPGGSLFVSAPARRTQVRRS